MMAAADVLPDLVVEVRSQTDRWTEIINNVGEYLTAGVGIVCVLDPQSVQAFVFYSSDQPPRFYRLRSAACGFAIREAASGMSVQKLPLTSFSMYIL